MNEIYSEREQTEAKHAILKRYLVPFANKILRTWDSLDFIDGFSGPWKSRDLENLSDTSIGIALETLSEVAKEIGHKPSNPRIRCIFNELDKTAYTRLCDFVERKAVDFPLVEVVTFQGKFEENAPAIRAASTHQFRLLFVDPKGYKGFPPSALAHFKGRPTEVFVNVMRSFMVRFLSGNHQDREEGLIELVGKQRAQYLLDTGLTIETLEAEYLSMLRGTLNYKYAGLSPIHNPDRNEIHFNLAYATNHPAGMDVMRTAEFKALSDHDRNRFAKATRDEPPDLFASLGDEMEIRGPYLRERERHLGQMEEVMLAIIDQHPNGIKFEELAALAQQTLYLRRTELSSEIVKMAAKGIANQPWKVRRGRTPRVDDVIKRA